MPVLRFTADKHHGHKRIIEFENRPFKDIEQMDNKLIQYHNEMVKDDDLTIDLGDFFFRGGYQAKNIHYFNYIKQYNGRYIIIRGNHEKHNKLIDPFQSSNLFLSGIKILCIHDPFNANTNYNLILHGHLHSALFMSELYEKNKISLMINVGCDCWNYRPVEWRKLFELYQQWKSGKFKVPIYDKQSVLKQRKLRKKNG